MFGKRKVKKEIILHELELEIRHLRQQIDHYRKLISETELNPNEWMYNLHMFDAFKHRHAEAVYIYEAFNKNL